MIQLQEDSLTIRFPEVHPRAALEVTFHRTFRIPDDGKSYPLPPSLGLFPLEHVDDHEDRLPAAWKERGGVMFPMYSAEAMWISFSSTYPMAVKVAAGKINAVTGEDWNESLARGEQDYLVVPTQPWLDGYTTEKGKIRQFVAMPLGTGYSVEEQLTGKAEHGGIQLLVHPMKKERYEEHMRSRSDMGVWDASSSFDEDVVCFQSAPAAIEMSPDMGLGMGGSMRQEVYSDEFGRDAWETSERARCFVHLVNAMLWKTLTDKEAPETPCTAEYYAARGLPWFEYYGEGKAALDGAEPFKDVKSVAEKGKEKGDVPLPSNESVDVQDDAVIPLGPGASKSKAEDEVREGPF